MIHFWKRYNIPVLLSTLVISLSSLAFYNYYTQKHILLKQMESDAEDTASSIVAAMDRFRDISSTMSLQKLVSDISLKLEIFEFRYIDPDGTIRNSMFQEEIGRNREGKSFKEATEGKSPLGKFFFETRDFVPVMAIYYPISMNGKLIGIIDLAVDVSEYAMVNTHHTTDFALLRRQVDILNLLKSIEGSIHNSIDIKTKADFQDFLRKYVESATNIVQISIVDSNQQILVSSNKAVIGQTLTSSDMPPPSIIKKNSQSVYRMVLPNFAVNSGKNERMLILIDADSYAKNEQRLFRTALLTAGIAILFALFIARIIYHSAIQRSREEQERLEKLVKERTHEIEILSKTDSLTGLWNRGYLEEMIMQEFKRSRRYGTELAIVVIDLDHFKQINDNYGHIAGDEVLRTISRRLVECLRETDFIGRYGGEEIVAILTDTSSENAWHTSQKILNVIASEPVTFGEISIPVTASIGISILHPEHENYEELFSEADKAMYTSKNGGRNRITLYQ